jgi:hypothetical protein
MLSLGIVSQEEFDMVYMLSYIAWPTEQVDQGVRIQEVGGRRTWSAGTEFAAARFTGGKASFDGSFTIPLRYIKECASRANLESEVELFITDGHAVAVSEHGQIKMALAKGDMSPIEDGTQCTTKIETTTVGLQHLLDFSTVAPIGALNEQETDMVPDIITFVVEDNLVGIRSEYTEVGCKTAFPQWEASIEGPAGEFSLFRRVARQFFFFLSNPKVGSFPVTILTDIENGNFVQFVSDDWIFQMPRIPAGAARYYQELTTRLDNLGLNVEESSDGKVCVQISDSNVVMQLLDGRVPVMRSTIELISGVESTPDLLLEIQQQNEGRIFTKYFMSNTSVIACADLRCSDLYHLEDHLNGLVNDSDLLGTYLASLGVVGDELSLF